VSRRVKSLRIGIVPQILKPNDDLKTNQRPSLGF
jgi:hypothetical protein